MRKQTAITQCALLQTTGTNRTVRTSQRVET